MSDIVYFYPKGKSRGFEVKNKSDILDILHEADASYKTIRLTSTGDRYEVYSSNSTKVNILVGYTDGLLD